MLNTPGTLNTSFYIPSANDTPATIASQKICKNCEYYNGIDSYSMGNCSPDGETITSCEPFWEGLPCFKPKKNLQ